MVIRGVNSRIVGLLRDFEDKPVPIAFVATRLQLTEEIVSANVLNLENRGVVELEGDEIMLISVPDASLETPDEEG